VVGANMRNAWIDTLSLFTGPLTAAGHSATLPPDLATPRAPRPATCGSRAHSVLQGLTLGDLGQ
jgi:hypothetical protein